MFQSFLELKFSFSLAWFHSGSVFSHKVIHILHTCRNKMFHVLVKDEKKNVSLNKSSMLFFLHDYKKEKSGSNQSVHKPCHPLKMRGSLIAVCSQTPGC